MKEIMRARILKLSIFLLPRFFLSGDLPPGLDTTFS